MACNALELEDRRRPGVLELEHLVSGVARLFKGRASRRLVAAVNGVPRRNYAAEFTSA